MNSNDNKNCLSDLTPHCIDVIQRINQERTRLLISPLEFSKRLTDHTKIHAKVMVQMKRCFHSTMKGHRQCVGVGKVNCVTNMKMLTLWMSDRPHYEVLMDSTMRYVGYWYEHDTENNDYYFCLNVSP